MILDELRKDKVILLKKMDKTYQSVGKVYFKPILDQVRFKKHTYKIPKEPSLINKYGKRTYYLELETGRQITYKDSKISNSFTATELDMILHQGIIRRFVKACTSVKTDINNWVMIMLALLAGLGLGIVIGLVIAGVI